MPVDFRISLAKPAEYRAAVTLLVREPTGFGGHVDDLLQQHADGNLPLDGLFVAQSDVSFPGHASETSVKSSELLGCGLALPQPHGMGFFWAPAISRAAVESLIENQAPGQPDLPAVAKSLALQTARGLLVAQIAHLEEHGCKLGQCLLPIDCDKQRTWLHAAGVEGITTIRYLRHNLQTMKFGVDPGHSAGQTQRPRLRKHTFRPGRDETMFARLLEATYVRSHDCPELDGYRDGADALAGHRLSGTFDPELWTAWFAQDQPIAIRLLAAHPDLNEWELVYFGVTDEARGQGWGRVLIEDALRAAADRASGLFLAVDSRNLYAIRVYEQLGFEEFAGQTLFLWRNPRG